MTTETDEMSRDVEAARAGLAALAAGEPTVPWGDVKARVLADEVPDALLAVAREAFTAAYDSDEVTVSELLDLRAAVAAVLAKVHAENWVIPRIPYGRWSVGPRVREDGLIRREAGTERAEHARVYAAKCLAAADQANKR